MPEKLFENTHELLEKVYEFVEDDEKMKKVHKILSGSELKHFYYVMDLCQAIYESENFFNE